jgi:hypothetical protein
MSIQFLAYCVPKVMLFLHRNSRLLRQKGFLGRPLLLNARYEYLDVRPNEQRYFNVFNGAVEDPSMVGPLPETSITSKETAVCVHKARVTPIPRR